MSNYPDFSAYGYQVEEEVKQNYAPGCTIYQATEIATQKPVLIEQFSLAEADKNYQLVVEVLPQLNCSGVPEYLDSFSDSEAFCLIRPEIATPSLASQNDLTYQEVKQIATGVLQILVKLQKQPLPLIHRQIQPENILWGDSPVYLVNFSSAVVIKEGYKIDEINQGTWGFMPPEQILHQPLNLASDLYSLGVTIICLLAGKKSTEIADIIDDTQSINFDFLVPSLNPRFVDWLDRMVSPSTRERYKNATEALAALQTIDSIAYQETTTKKRKSLPLIPLAAAVFIVLLGFIPASIYSQKSIFANGKQLGVNKTTNLIKKETSSLPQGEEARKQLLATGECRDCNLAWANLGGANLAGVDLKGANLEGASLVGANLEEANLVNCNLKSARLENANLINANLRGANLEIASLFSTNLAGANLSYANLQRANLMAANLKYAKLWQADVQGAMMPNGVNVSY
ncbi:MAG: pentapeptide repeat-containing protein [Spirulinaceae cyanobacterium]